MSKNIAAFTSTDRDYPAFISVNDGDGITGVEITIRSKAVQKGQHLGTGDFGVISMTPDEWKGFVKEILRYKDNQHLIISVDEPETKPDAGGLVSALEDIEEYSRPLYIVTKSSTFSHIANTAEKALASYRGEK